jgi:hypothetical protein
LKGGFDGKIEDRKPGNENGSGSCEQKIVESDVDPVGIIPENSLHDKENNGPGYPIR